MSLVKGLNPFVFDLDCPLIILVRGFAVFPLYAFRKGDSATLLNYDRRC